MDSNGNFFHFFFRFSNYNIYLGSLLLLIHETKEHAKRDEIRVKAAISGRLLLVDRVFYFLE